MKKTLLKTLSVVLAVLMFSLEPANLYAGAIDVPVTLDESAFTLDEAALNSAMSELDEMDDFVEANEGVTVAELQDEGFKISADEDDDAATDTSKRRRGRRGSDPPLGIPSFLWGFFLGVIGIILVYVLTDQDMDEAKKALWGCIAWTAISVLLIFVVFASAASSVDDVANSSSGF